MDIIFNKTYTNFSFRIELSNNSGSDLELTDDVYCYIDDELVFQLHSNDLIDKKINEHIPPFLIDLYDELYGVDIFDEVCKDVNGFVMTWVW